MTWLHDVTTAAFGSATTAAAFAVHLRGLRSRLSKAQHAATTDPLTGLANRIGLRQDFERTVVAAGPCGQVAAAFVDVDDFKHINDTHGHDTGDAALQHIAACLRQTSQLDSVARLSGDEFVLLAAARDETARHALEAEIGRAVVRISSTDAPVNVSVSVGVAVLPAVSADLEQLLAAADAAMYRAKHTPDRRAHYAPDDGPAIRAARAPQRTRDRNTSASTTWRTA